MSLPSMYRNRVIVLSSTSSSSSSEVPLLPLRSLPSRKRATSSAARFWRTLMKHSKASLREWPNCSLELKAS